MHSVSSGACEGQRASNSLKLTWGTWCGCRQQSPSKSRKCCLRAEPSPQPRDSKLFLEKEIEHVLLYNPEETWSGIRASCRQPVSRHVVITRTGDCVRTVFLERPWLRSLFQAELESRWYNGHRLSWLLGICQGVTFPMRRHSLILAVYPAVATLTRSWTRARNLPNSNYKPKGVVLGLSVAQKSLCHLTVGKNIFLMSI